MHCIERPAGNGRPCSRRDGWGRKRQLGRVTKLGRAASVNFCNERLNKIGLFFYETENRVMMYSGVIANELYL